MALPRSGAGFTHSDRVLVWILGGLTVWLVVGLLFALVVGKGIRLADERSPATGVTRTLTTADLPAAMTAPASVHAATPRAAVRRRPIPLPPIGVALAATAVALETTGFVLRLNGATGPTAQLLSMDAPFSIPRLFVASLFAGAAVVALAGARVQPGRRAWWTAVALVAVAIAAVKAGSTVHAEAVRALADRVGSTGALVLSAALAVAVVATLWSLSRHERRDRRRVLSALSFYAVAAVGLSALTGVVAGAAGRASTWTTTAAFLEESGEALAGVTFVLAVLVGVAPALVLPGTWALRRRADAQSLEIGVQLPNPSTRPGPGSA